uniref:Uncharacterized protein n=1 Tax=Sipha flava TaxID=143950 RepID=A0A2S2QWX8_9HEMI
MTIQHHRKMSYIIAMYQYTQFYQIKLLNDEELIVNWTIGLPTKFHTRRRHRIFQQCKQYYTRETDVRGWTRRGCVGILSVKRLFIYTVVHIRYIYLCFLYSFGHDDDGFFLSLSHPPALFIFLSHSQSLYFSFPLSL